MEFTQRLRVIRCQKIENKSKEFYAFLLAMFQKKQKDYYRFFYKMLKNILLFHSMHEILAASCECCQVSSTSYLPPKQECHAGGCNSSLRRVRRNVAQEIQRHFVMKKVNGILY